MLDTHLKSARHTLEARLGGERGILAGSAQCDMPRRNPLRWSDGGETDAGSRLSGDGTTRMSQKVMLSA